MRPISFIRTRPRLVLSLLAGLAIFLILPAAMHLRHRVLIAWNVTQWLYLIRLFGLVIGATPEQVRKTAEKLDEGADLVLGFFTVAALMSLGAIILELASGKQAEGFEKPCTSGFRPSPWRASG